jgi:hypothetical protein
MGRCSHALRPLTKRMARCIVEFSPATRGPGTLDDSLVGDLSGAHDTQYLIYIFSAEWVPYVVYKLQHHNWLQQTEN